MIYAVAAAFLAGLVCGWAMRAWLFAPAALPVTGGPQDVAVVEAQKTAGAPAELAATQAAEEIKDAPDNVIDARALELMRRGREGK